MEVREMVAPRGPFAVDVDADHDEEGEEEDADEGVEDGEGVGLHFCRHIFHLARCWCCWC